MKHHRPEQQWLRDMQRTDSKLGAFIASAIIGIGFAAMLVFGLDHQLQVEEQQAIQYQATVNQGADK